MRIFAVTFLAFLALGLTGETGLAQSKSQINPYYTLKQRVDADDAFVQGLFHYNNMEFLPAIDFFRKAVEAMPLNDKANFWLGKSYLMAGFTAQAIAQWENMVKINSADIFIRQKLQELYTEAFMDNKVDMNNAFVFLKYMYSSIGVTSIETDAQNNLYISNFNNGNVEVRNTNFEPLYTLSDSVQKPMDVAIEDELVAVASFGSDEVLIFHRDNKKLLFKIGGFGIKEGQFTGPAGVFLKNRVLYVCDSGNNRVQAFRIMNPPQFLMSFGGKGKEAGKFFKPSDLVVHQNKIWVADSGNRRVQVFDDSGNFLYQFGEEDFDIPRKILVQQNKLYIADENKGLMLYDEENKSLKTIKSLNEDVQKPVVAVNFDQNGLLYFADFLTNKMTVFARDKMKLTSLKVDSLLTLNNGYPNIAMKLRVQDIKGKDITGLNFSNFKLLHEGNIVKEYNVFQLKPESKKISLLILNRTSQSMKKYQKEVYEYLQKVFKDIKFNDQVSITYFNNEITPAVPFTNQNLTLLQGIEKAEYTDTKTGVFDNALYQAVTRNLNNEFYNAILVIDDGKSKENFTKYSAETLAHYARKNGVPVFVLALDEGSLTAKLKFIAEESKGMYLHFFKSNQIYSIIELARKMQPVFYLLTYQSPLYKKVNRNHWINLNVEVNYKGLYGAEKSGFVIP